MRRTVFSLALVLPAACTGPAGPVRDGRRVTRTPNIVIVLADDLGFGDPSSYNDQSKIRTPNIDRLAAEGLRLTDAHSPASVCTPTRYGLLTGRYAWRTGLPNGVIWPWDPPLLENARVTLPELLQARGYATACIGKWHLGWDWPLVEGGHIADEFRGQRMSVAERTAVQERIDFTRRIRRGPLAHGFDHYFGDDVPNFPPYAFIANDRLTVQPTTRNDDRFYGHDGPMAPGWDLSAVLPVLTQHAASFIDEHARTRPSQPFFLFFSLTSPHTPIAPSYRWVTSTGAGSYGDFVAETDWALGEVLDAIARNDLDRDTLIVFTSDNGSPQRDGTGHSGAVGSVKERFGHDPSRPWRGMKGDAWEGGHRVPFVARWTGVTPAGAESAQPVVLTDLYRTIAGIVDSPVGEGAGEDSFDFSDTLFDRPPTGPRRDHLVHHSNRGVFAIREGDWKLILGKGSGGFSNWTPPEDAPDGQLYDLAADPGETTNLWREQPDIVARLTERLRQIRAADRSVPGTRGIEPPVVESRDPGTGKLRFLEVKGRISGADTTTVTRNEILYSLNKPEEFILAIVEFEGDDSHRAHYLRRPFQKDPDFGVTSVNYNLPELLARAEEPR